MSIMLDNHNHNMMEQVVSSGVFPKISPSMLESDDRTVMRATLHEDRENGSGSDPCSSSSSSSSSIGVNSDDDDDDIRNNNGDEDVDVDEVESKLNANSPFESAVDALEQALPIRRGISNFYNGKSKSFASLADAACSSIKDITKTENAYSRKRKNILAYNLYDQGRTSMLKSPGVGGGIAKRSTSSRQTTLNNCESDIDENGSAVKVNERKSSRIPSVSRTLLPIPPSPWRSFSHADLQYCGYVAPTRLQVSDATHCRVSDTAIL